MKRFRRILRWPIWLLEAIPFFLFMGIFKLIGVDASSATGGWLARTLAPLAPAHRTARRNIERAFPEMSPAEVKKTLSDMWDNLGRTTAEYAHFKAFAGFPNKRVEMHNLEIPQAALARGKGAILFSGHIANWEVLSVSIYNAGFDGAAIYRVVNNPFIDWFVLRQRLRFAYKRMVAKNRDGSRELLRALKEGKVVAMLADQKLREGVAVPLFGRDAMTAPGVAVLSLRTGSGVVPMQMERIGGARFRMTFLPELEITRSGDKDEDVKAVLTAMNQSLEAIIRQRPGQWLWAHRRWPDEPAA